ncbi:hypothetical protein VTJ49DRAFT_3785 [Mycothermus thermophilus]|uniref:Uncharacterized protein n=1 Tax=Humicola insolens TaxID=85995 RepID=A0ABR3V6N9_HUMIN
MEQPPQPPPTPTTPFTPTTPVTNTTNMNTTPTNPTPPPTPTPFQRPSPTLTTRRSTLSPAFRAKLSLMATRLAPLVQLTTGQVHPSFPRTVLAFWLLTDAELDDLAHFYHQRTPGPWTSQYPCPVAWPNKGRGMSVEQKRRKMGRFIGLRGCESPVGNGNGQGWWWPCPVSGAFVENGGRDGDGDGDADVEMGGMSEEVEEVRRKMGWY